jgi:hypothetical protein
VTALGKAISIGGANTGRRTGDEHSGGPVLAPSLL